MSAPLTMLIESNVLKMTLTLHKHVVAAVHGICAVRNFQIEIKIWFIKWKNKIIVHWRNIGCVVVVGI